MLYKGKQNLLFIYISVLLHVNNTFLCDSFQIQNIKQKGLDIEQKDENGSNQNNEHDSGRKSVTNKYTKIENLLYDYAKGNKSTLKEIFNALQQQEKADVVMEIYREIADEIDRINLNTEEDVLELKRKLFTQARDKVIRIFLKSGLFRKMNLIYQLYSMLQVLIVFQILVE